MHQYERRILEVLAEREELEAASLAKESGLKPDQFTWAVENLASAGMVTVKRGTRETITLTEEGKADLKGFPEERLLKEAKSGKLHIGKVQDKVALGWARKNGWLDVSKDGLLALTKAGSSVEGGVSEYNQRKVLEALSKGAAQLSSMSKADREVADALLKRHLLSVSSKGAIDSVAITGKGRESVSGAAKAGEIGVLTRQMIESGAWKDAPFRPYNVTASAERAFPSRLHPYRELSNAVRKVWLEMGFTEVAGPAVESSFWNFDALFSPQDHPTREMQDTFFLSNPSSMKIEDVEALRRVKREHLAGWGDTWEESTAQKAVLRTHTTSITAHNMRRLAQMASSTYPVKMFSVGSVFRNENLDYKHLAELHQYDGMIVGENLTVANLIDTVKRFFGKMGFEGISIVPSYFPFTEPSLEVFYYDKNKKDYIELMGGGVIRKEITRALGLNKSVLAWGGGLDRLLLNQDIMGVDSIVTVYKNNLGWLRTRPNVKV